MSCGADISTLYRDFSQALTDVLAEDAAGPASRGRLARTRAAVKKHPEYSEHGYFLAVETAWIGNSVQRLSLERRVPTPRGRVWHPQLLACVLERLESDGWETVQQPKLSSAVRTWFTTQRAECLTALRDWPDSTEVEPQ